MMAWAFTYAILCSAAVAAAAYTSTPLHKDSINFVNISRFSTNGSTAMFLPLFFNNLNHRRPKEYFYPRRHLNDRPAVSARMPLHDDLLLNGSPSASLFNLVFLRWSWDLISKYLIVCVLLQILYDSSVDRDTAAEIRSYSWYRQYCYLCSLFHLRTVWKASGFFFLSSDL